MERIVIVGAGQAGGCAAAAIRAANAECCISLIGLEQYPPYERPPLSKELLAGDFEVERTFIRPSEWYERSNIELRLGKQITLLEPKLKQVRFSDGEEINYDKLLLTTGARAKTLPFAPPGSNIFYLRDINDSLRLRAKLRSGYRLAVIGGGFIGLEVAAAARKYGAEVTVFEGSSSVLSRVLPEKIATIVSQIHLDQGVSFHFHCSIQAIQDGTTIEILLKDRSLIKVDGVAVGIGAQPNDELARAAGLHVDDGIVVDEFGRTSAQGIYAAGDVTKHFNPLLKRYLRLETWQNAQNQGISVANVVAGMPKPFAEVPWAWSDQFGNNIQISGAPLRWDELVIRGNLSAKRFTAFQISQDTVVGAITLNNPREMRTAKRLIASGAKITLSKLADESQTID